jgi:hypothetical protein
MPPDLKIAQTAWEKKRSKKGNKNKSKKLEWSQGKSGRNFKGVSCPTYLIWMTSSAVNT